MWIIRNNVINELKYMYLIISRMLFFYNQSSFFQHSFIAVEYLKVTRRNSQATGTSCDFYGPCFLCREVVITTSASPEVCRRWSTLIQLIRVIFRRSASLCRLCRARCRHVLNILRLKEILIAKISVTFVDVNLIFFSFFDLLLTFWELLTATNTFFYLLTYQSEALLLRINLFLLVTLLFGPSKIVHHPTLLPSKRNLFL